MTLVDTSSWIHFLRRSGDPRVRDRVTALLEADEAAWCPMVRLELWNGVGSDRDREVLRELGTLLVELPVGPETWAAAAEMADRCRSQGRTAPVQDILIAACARQHRVGIEAVDRHYDWLMKA